MDAYLSIALHDLEGTACDFWWVDWQQGTTSKIPGLDFLYSKSFSFHAPQRNPEQGAAYILLVRWTWEPPLSLRLFWGRHHFLGKSEALARVYCHSL